MIADSLDAEVHTKLYIVLLHVHCKNMKVEGNGSEQGSGNRRQAKPGNGLDVAKNRGQYVTMQLPDCKLNGIPKVQLSLHTEYISLIWIISLIFDSIESIQHRTNRTNFRVFVQYHSF